VKKNKKPVFFIVFILVILFSVSTVFGYKSYFGDIEKTHVNSARNIRLGRDLDDAYTAVLTPPEGAYVTPEIMQNAAKTISLRLEAFNIDAGEVICDTEKNQITVTVSGSVYNAEGLVKELANKGEMTFRAGGEYSTSIEGDVDELGNPLPVDTVVPTGEIGLSSADIDYAEVKEVANGNTKLSDVYYYVVIHFKEESKKTLSEFTGDLLMSEPKQNLSIWIDGSRLFDQAVSEQFKSGSFPIVSQNEASAKYLAARINAGANPFRLTTLSEGKTEAGIGNVKNSIVYAGLGAVALATVILIVLYKLTGFFALFTLTGQIAGCLAVFTGWFGFMNYHVLTLPGIIGLMISLIIGIGTVIMICERIKGEKALGKPADAAIESAFKRTYRTVLDTGIVAAVIASALMIADHGKGGIYYLGFSLISGVVFNVVMNVFCLQTMVGAWISKKAKTDKEAKSNG